MEGRIVQKLECRPYGKINVNIYIHFLRNMFYYKIIFLADNCYMKLKLESIKRASVPQRQVQQLDRVVQNFKPVSDHKHNVSIILLIFFILLDRSFICKNILQIEYAEKKKAEGKKMRDDKDAVLDMLFAAFEKHQYYNIRDLVKITRQPIVNNPINKPIVYIFTSSGNNLEVVVYLKN